MAFDPEKIARVNVDCATQSDYASQSGEYVYASDYDQLLALYREAVGKLQVIAETHDGYPNTTGQLQGVARRCLNSIGVRYEIVLASLMPPEPFHTHTSFTRKEGK
jgi:aspartate/tyrosine/aromatic aminotransferase